MGQMDQEIPDKFVLTYSGIFKIFPTLIKIAHARCWRANMDVVLFSDDPGRDVTMKNVKKWLAATFICSYLSVLSFGVVSHTFGIGVSSHPAMYFIVWDMFCGWNAYSSRTHVISEGVSGDYYRLTPAPWGTFVPFGAVERQHYDSFNLFAGRLGVNALKNTEHEEMTRILVIEESWPKKFNIPDHIWNAAYDEPRDVYKYYRVRSELDPEGHVQGVQSSFLESQIARIMMENPQIRKDARKGRAPYIVNGPQGSRTQHSSDSSPFPGLAPNAQ